MGVIGKSELPGHKLLRKRICTALECCQEFQDIEFKESETWEKLKVDIIRTAIGMGNLQDGGIIIIGVAQRDNEWQLEGIKSEHLETFDEDVVKDQVNSYVSPHVDLTLITVDYSKHQRFLAIAVSEFAEVPLICKKNSNSKDLQEGAVYIRPPGGRARTTRVMQAEQMRELLNLAAEKTARQILEVAHRIGLNPEPSSTKHFDEEIEDLFSPTIQLPVNVLKYPHWDINFRPEVYNSEAIPSLRECLKTIGQARVSLRGWSYPAKDYPEQSGQGENWVSAWSDFGHLEYWRFYQSTQFVHLNSFWEETEIWLKHKDALLNEQHSRRLRVNQHPMQGVLALENFVYTTTEIFEFAARLCKRGVYRRSLTLKIKLAKIKDFALVEISNNGAVWSDFYQTSQDSIEYSCSLQSDELVANSAEHAAKAVSWFAERFGWLDLPVEPLRSIQRKLLKNTT
jgi:hypothetical protein